MPEAQTVIKVKVGLLELAFSRGKSGLHAESPLTVLGHAQFQLAHSCQRPSIVIPASIAFPLKIRAHLLLTYALNISYLSTVPNLVGRDIISTHARQCADSRCSRSSRIIADLLAQNAVCSASTASE